MYQIVRTFKRRRNPYPNWAKPGSGAYPDFTYATYSVVLGNFQSFVQATKRFWEVSAKYTYSDFKHLLICENRVCAEF